MGYYTDAVGFKARIDEISAQMPDTIDDNFTFKNGLSLQKMKKNAITNLKGILGLLGYTDEDPLKGLEKLNKKISEYQKLTINFNGPALRANVINALTQQVSKRSVELEKMMTAEIEKQEAIFPTLFQKLIDQTAKNFNFTDKDLEKISSLNSIAEELFAELNFNVVISESGTSVKVKTPKMGKLLPKRMVDEIRDELKEDYMNPEQLKKALKRIGAKDYDNLRQRVIALAKDYHLDSDPSVSSIMQQLEPDIQVEVKDEYITSYYDLIGPFEKLMTPVMRRNKKGEMQLIIAEDSARELFEGKDGDIYKKQLWESAQEYFHSLIPSDMLGNKYLLNKFDDALRNMIYTYPAAFFTGKNDSEIIGVLGELEGLYYLYAIMGDNKVNLNEVSAEWIGSVTTVGDGAKTGADLVVKLGEQIGYGIQVKNSMELTGSTGLSDFTLDDIKGNKGFQAQINAFFGADFGQMLEDLLTMSSFNIGYVHEKKKNNGVKVIPGEPPFTTTSEAWRQGYAKLPELINKAYQLMTIAAAMITRMQYAQDQNFLEANTLYIIGGTAIISSAQILDQIINQVNNIENSNRIFSINTSTKFDKKDYTIVDYINSGGGNLAGVKSTVSTSFNFHKVTSFNG